MSSTRIQPTADSQRQTQEVRSSSVSDVKATLTAPETPRPGTTPLRLKIQGIVESAAADAAALNDSHAHQPNPNDTEAPIDTEAPKDTEAPIDTEDTEDTEDTMYNPTQVSERRAKLVQFAADAKKRKEKRSRKKYESFQHTQFADDTDTIPKTNPAKRRRRDSKDAKKRVADAINPLLEIPAEDFARRLEGDLNLRTNLTKHIVELLDSDPNASALITEYILRFGRRDLIRFITAIEHKWEPDWNFDAAEKDREGVKRHARPFRRLVRNKGNGGGGDDSSDGDNSSSDDDEPYNPDADDTDEDMQPVNVPRPKKRNVLDSDSDDSGDPEDPEDSEDPDDMHPELGFRNSTRPLKKTMTLDWAKCIHCGKSRLLKDGVNSSSLGNTFYCGHEACDLFGLDGELLENIDALNNQSNDSTRSEMQKTVCKQWDPEISGDAIKRRLMEPADYITETYMESSSGDDDSDRDGGFIDDAARDTDDEDGRPVRWPTLVFRLSKLIGEKLKHIRKDITDVRETNKQSHKNTLREIILKVSQPSTDRLKQLREEDERYAKSVKELNDDEANVKRYEELLHDLKQKNIETKRNALNNLIDLLTDMDSQEESNIIEDIEDILTKMPPAVESKQTGVTTDTNEQKVLLALRQSKGPVHGNKIDIGQPGDNTPALNALNRMSANYVFLGTTQPLLGPVIRISLPGMMHQYILRDHISAVDDNDDNVRVANSAIPFIKGGIYRTLFNMLEKPENPGAKIPVDMEAIMNTITSLIKSEHEISQEAIKFITDVWIDVLNNANSKQAPRTYLAGTISRAENNRWLSGINGINGISLETPKSPEIPENPPQDTGKDTGKDTEIDTEKDTEKDTNLFDGMF